MIEPILTPIARYTWFFTDANPPPEEASKPKAKQPAWQFFNKIKDQVASTTIRRTIQLPILWPRLRFR